MFVSRKPCFPHRHVSRTTYTEGQREQDARMGNGTRRGKKGRRLPLSLRSGPNGYRATAMGRKLQQRRRPRLGPTWDPGLRMCACSLLRQSSATAISIRRGPHSRSGAPSQRRRVSSERSLSQSRPSTRHGTSGSGFPGAWPPHSPFTQAYAPPFHCCMDPKPEIGSGATRLLHAYMQSSRPPTGAPGTAQISSPASTTSRPMQPQP
jgi:hypothetical protein